MSVPLSPHAVAPDLESWRAPAACQLGDHELFFPPEEEQGEYFRLRVSLAKRICASCPVRRPCADYALAGLRLPPLLRSLGGQGARCRVA